MFVCFSCSFHFAKAASKSEFQNKSLSFIFVHRNRNQTVHCISFVLFCFDKKSPIVTTCVNQWSDFYLLRENNRKQTPHVGETEAVRCETILLVTMGSKSLCLLDVIRLSILTLCSNGLTHLFVFYFTRSFDRSDNLLFSRFLPGIPSVHCFSYYLSIF